MLFVCMNEHLFCVSPFFLLLILFSNAYQYPIPRQKGGRRKKSDLILSESQLPFGYYKRKRKLAGKMSDLSDPDLPMMSEKSLHGNERIVVGYGRKNPNQPRKKIGIFFIFLFFFVRQNWEYDWSLKIFSCF